MVHGKTSRIFHDEKGLFAGLPNPFEATRYHSLIVARDSLPDCLEVTAKTWDEEIMGLRHKTLAVEGVQFHPESFLTTSGKDLLRNFVSRTLKGSQAPRDGAPAGDPPAPHAIVSRGRPS